MEQVHISLNKWNFQYQVEYEIVGAYKKQGGKIIGDFIPNPNFGGN